MCAGGGVRIGGPLPLMPNLVSQNSCRPPLGPSAQPWGHNHVLWLVSQTLLGTCCMHDTAGDWVT